MKASRVEIRDRTDVVTARRDGRDMARALGFGSADQTRLATAISELIRNVIQYAGFGFCVIENASSPEFVEVRVVVGDSGPGIPDLQEALRDGFSTGGGLGSGLPRTRRLVHSLDIISEPGNTRVEITVRRSRS
ncbi:MAG: ATP-binding protein [Myxococcota bacterium]|jgi:serine/threonine-protein kinase RsbT|nr:anti-sigma regulatory factor [Deltaproteobacteria bacterium]MCP4240541.1 anti-sigma regulatory factor [bacterium]MDP7076627.1 ATP-binding protein [Myxococcota bacterium]MDP7298824.1 ATP-binding protein [Myxococcota bacterium]MDP7433418.1 ATP-binding protein [Myxococcota bacterium]